MTITELAGLSLINLNAAADFKGKALSLIPWSKQPWPSFKDLTFAEQWTTRELNEVAAWLEYQSYNEDPLLARYFLSNYGSRLIKADFQAIVGLGASGYDYPQNIPLESNKNNKFDLLITAKRIITAWQQQGIINDNWIIISDELSSTENMSPGLISQYEKYKQLEPGLLEEFELQELRSNNWLKTPNWDNIINAFSEPAVWQYQTNSFRCYPIFLAPVSDYIFFLDDLNDDYKKNPKFGLQRRQRINFLQKQAKQVWKTEQILAEENNLPINLQPIKRSPRITEFALPEELTIKNLAELRLNPWYFFWHRIWKIRPPGKILGEPNLSFFIKEPESSHPAKILWNKYLWTQPYSQNQFPIAKKKIKIDLYKIDQDLAWIHHKIPETKTKILNNLADYPDFAVSFLIAFDHLQLTEFIIADKKQQLRFSKTDLTNINLTNIIENILNNNKILVPEQEINFAYKNLLRLEKLDKTSHGNDEGK